MLRALAAADDAGVRGPKVTPFVLVAASRPRPTASRSGQPGAAENNAAVAAQVAAALLER